MNKHFKQALNYSVAGSLGIVVVSALTGCENKNSSSYEQKQNQFLVIEEKPEGVYTVTNQYPTDGANRAILKDINGNERIINEQEMKELAKNEIPKIKDGNSNLTSNSGGGLSLGETIMAVAGGALLGNLIGNALSNQLRGNQNFQNKQQRANRTSGFSRSANTNTRAKKTTSSSRGGFFGSKGSSRAGGRTTRGSSRGGFRGFGG